MQAKPNFALQEAYTAYLTKLRNAAWAGWDSARKPVEVTQTTTVGHSFELLMSPI